MLSINTDWPADWQPSDGFRDERFPRGRCLSGNQSEWAKSISLTLLCSSAGGNAKLRYQITSGNTGGVFDVEPEVGTIFVAQPLDYEQNKR